MEIIKVVKVLKNKLLSGSNRSIEVKKNILYTFSLKSLSILASMFLVRITYNFLDNKAIYGVWMTILSITSWVNYFDVGLGNGLRNKLAESISKSKTRKGKAYVSTAYAIIALFVISLALIYLLIAPFINWNEILNIKLISRNELSILFKIILISYLFRFLLSLINSISFAFQDAMMPSLFKVASKLLILFVLVFLLKLGFSGIFIVGGVYSGINVLVLFLASIFLFLTKYRSVMPSFKFIKLDFASDLFNLGIKFFVIQIAALIIFTTDNIIITRVLGPEYVTNYQVVFKLFNLFNVLATIILTPIWSAYTDAFAKNDYNWMKNILKKLIYLMIPLIIIVCIVMFFSKKLF